MRYIHRLMIHTFGRYVNIIKHRESFVNTVYKISVDIPHIYIEYILIILADNSEMGSLYI